MLLAWLDGRRGGVSGDDEEDFAIFVIIADWLVGFGSFFGNLVILIDGGFGRRQCALRLQCNRDILYSRVLCDVRYALRGWNVREIYKQEEDTVWKGILATSLMAAVILTILLARVLSGSHFHQSEAKYFCMIDWSTKDTACIPTITVSIGMLAVALLVTALCYYLIYAKIIKFVRESESAVVSKIPSDLSHHELLLVSKRRVRVIVDMLVSIIATMNSFVDFSVCSLTLVGILNPFYRKSIF
jgi:hypothetical protein